MADLDMERLMLRLINRVEELEDRIESLEKQLGEQKKSDEIVPLTMPESITTNSDVRKAMILLARQELLTGEEVTDMLNPAWCVDYLRLNFPMLRSVTAGRLDEKGYPRYWRDELELYGQKFYVCSQWYPHNRGYFEKWLKNKFKK